MKKQNKRNIKKNRKQVNRKLQSLKPSIGNSHLKETIKIDDSSPVIFKRDLGDMYFDSLSDSMSKTITNNWLNLGGPRIASGEGEPYSEIENLKKYNSKMFLEMGTKGEYYHLTSPKNWYKMKKEGLKSIGVNRTTSMGCNGKIWVVESNKPEVWNYVGYNQLTVGIENLPLVVVKINPEGVTGRISSEDGNDFPTLLHTVINQNEIESKYLEKVGVFYSNRKSYYNLKPILSELKNEFYKGRGLLNMLFKKVS